MGKQVKPEDYEYETDDLAMQWAGIFLLFGIIVPVVVLAVLWLGGAF